MSALNPDKLLNCPYCNEPVKDSSYDRRFVLSCRKCNWEKGYPGLLQPVPNNAPIPYSDGNGGIIDPSKVKYQEYYHYNAIENTINQFNNWVNNTILQQKRDKKLNEINDT